MANQEIIMLDGTDSMDRIVVLGKAPGNRLWCDIQIACSGNWRTRIAGVAIDAEVLRKLNDLMANLPSPK